MWKCVKRIIRSIYRICRSVCAIVGLITLLCLFCYPYYLQPEMKPLYKASHKIQKIFSKLKRQTGMSMKVPRLYISQEGWLNAYATRDKIVITERMLKFLGNEDQIATVLSHEIAHVLLGHTEETSRVLSGMEQEYQADQYGAFLMMKAGYDICEGSKWPLKLLEKYGDNVDPKSHPNRIFRYYNMQIPNCK